jgi:hypothetical protein
MGKDPTFALIYGEGKLGKTTDCLYSFPFALWIAAPGALNPSEGVCGYTVDKSRVFDLQSIAEVTDRLQRLRPHVVDAVVIDDLSLLAERSVLALQKQGFDKYVLWGRVRNDFLALRDVARRCGVHVVMNAHLGPPRMILNARVRGGPMLQGKAADDLPKACDIVLRAQPIPRLDKPFGLPVVYRCTPEDPDYVSGDRNHVTPDFAPVNIGEILRLAGHPLRRLFDWQEAVVERAATRLHPPSGAASSASGAVGGTSRVADVDYVRSILAATLEHVTKKLGKDERHAIWTARDAYDRAVLRSRLSAHRRAYYA